jgi:type I restriction enzyme M protein
VLFIDARKMGHMVDRVRREFSNEDIEQIAGTYRRWRTKPETLAEKGWEAYADTPGFCKSEGLETIRKFDHVLTPGRYVGAADVEDDGVPFEEKFASLRANLINMQERSRELDTGIEAALGLFDGR